MRWDALFGDMEAQLASVDRLDLESEISERSRAEVAGVELADRLRGSMGLRVAVHLVSGAVFEGTLGHVGGESLLLNDHHHQVLVPFAAVSRYHGLGRLAVSEPSSVRRKLGLASALRALARDRADLAVVLVGGTQEAAVLSGVIDRVGRDYLDLALTRPGEARRAANVSQIASVPFSSLGALRSVRGTEGHQ
ncbi:hypothetical protein TV39_14000 [Arthrobacter sp. SPG23]|uniref:hypothetical protein n=1 Tax=Arthrobacter sp. SPG23 TaxID=1610703 RepID=UPI0005BB2D77|nr:hypothetical protein [Arthrobacter sp. SPG23]KIS26879.1 hypothetical protein TV39_14000 [Arthrobacter sp. SPG23]